MRSILLISLMLSALTCAACSYSTDFVVVNESGRPIMIRYKVKGPPLGSPTLTADPEVLTGSPAKMDASQLGSRGRDLWQPLSPDQYRIDQESRTVTVALSPREALRVTSMFHYIGDEDPNDVAAWPIEEITISGDDGEMTFKGQKARKSFCYVSRVLYTLTYK
jgi:hypothetical protein